MDFDKEKLKFDLMDCFDDSTWDKYDFDKLVGNAVVDDDFIVIRGSNFKACLRLLKVLRRLRQHAL